MITESALSGSEAPRKPDAKEKTGVHFPTIQKIADSTRSTAGDAITAQRLQSDVEKRTLVEKVEITKASELPEIAVQIKHFCEKAGLAAMHTSELLLAAMEMVRNVQDHAPCGGIVLRAVCRDSRSGIKLEIWDSGNGMDFEFVEKILYGDPSTHTKGFSIAKESTENFNIISGPNGTQVFLEKFNDELVN